MAQNPMEVRHLDIDAVVPFLSATSNEFKCLVLGEVPEGEGRSLVDIHRALAVPSEQGMLYDLGVRAVHGVVNNLPSGLVEIEHDSKGTYARRTANGTLAAALAGHRLDLSLRTSISTRKVGGEPIVKSMANGVQPMNATESRLVVLLNLLSGTKDEWINGPDLNVINAKYGLTRESTRTHLDRLEETGIVEIRTSKDDGSPIIRKQVRLKPEGDYMSPRLLVERYLAIVGSFAVLNSSFVAEGLAVLNSIRSQRSQVPYLILKSFASSSHTAKQSLH